MGEWEYGRPCPLSMAPGNDIVSPSLMPTTRPRSPPSLLERAHAPVSLANPCIVRRSRWRHIPGPFPRLVVLFPCARYWYRSLVSGFEEPTPTYAYMHVQQHHTHTHPNRAAYRQPPYTHDVHSTHSVALHCIAGWRLQTTQHD